MVGSGGPFSLASITTSTRSTRQSKAPSPRGRSTSKSESVPTADEPNTFTGAPDTNKPSGDSAQSIRTQIIVDDREPTEILSKLPEDAIIARMDYGDYVFVRPDLSVGVERKTVADLLGSLANGRIDRQVAGLCAAYDVPILLIQGDLLPGRTGKIKVHGKESGWHYDAVMNRLMTFQEYGVRLSFSPDSAEWLLRRLKSLRSFYAQNEHQLKPRIEMAVTKANYSHSELALSQVPGVGLDRSRKLHKQFGTLLAIVTATEEQLRFVPGIGPKIATELWRTFRGE